MKKTTFILLFFFSICSLFAQELKFEQEKVNGDIIYYNKARGTGGRMFSHLSNNSLAINVGNDFTGGVEIRSSLFLRGDEDRTPFGVYGKRIYFGAPYDNTDPMWIGRFNVNGDISELRINIGDDNNDKLVIGRKWMYLAEPAFTPVLIVQPNTADNGGRVGINQYNPRYTLDVNGTIHAKEVKIDNNGWADFVFDKNYKLRSLSEVEKYINVYSSLPEIPTEAEVKENGVDVGEMQVKLLQKIEELTLYAIQQQKQLNEQSKLIEAQGKLIQELQIKK